jgi:hypothetical protein
MRSNANTARKANDEETDPVDFLILEFMGSNHPF